MAAEAIRLERDGVVITVGPEAVEEMGKLGFKEPKPMSQPKKTATSK